MNWEYTIVYITVNNIEDIEEELNYYGKRGWELVGFDEKSYIFKRPKHDY